MRWPPKHRSRRAIFWHKFGLVGLVILTVASLAGGADWPQFRGPNRDGKSTETDLLTEWPVEGPNLLWVVEDLGAGYASVIASNGTLYTTGLEDETGFIYAYNLQGEPVWKQSYGPEWSGSYPGTRTTPTVDGPLLFVMSGHGLVVCFDTIKKQMKWAVDTKEAYGGRNVNWGITESLLVDGDNLICTPGGSEAAIVALNKNTGHTAWTCRALNEKSAYCSPILIHCGQQRLIVTLTANSLVGLDAQTGKMLWRHPHNAAYRIHATSPVYDDGKIYITSGYGGQRGEMLELAPDGKSIKKIWSDNILDNKHGGVIALSGYVYGTSEKNRRGNWVCLNLSTGTMEAETAAVGMGSVAYADGMLYGYGENGQVGLIKASPKDFNLISSFEVTRGNGYHWAHPMVSGGRLYIRHGNAIIAYDIKDTH